MNLNIIGAINDLSYGNVTSNIVHELIKKNINVSLFPIGQVGTFHPKHGQNLQLSVNNAEIPDFNADCVRIWHQFDLSMFVGSGKKIGFPIFELNDFTAKEKAHLSWLDKIFVCSHWAKKVIVDVLDYNEDNTHVVPLGVDLEIFKPSHLKLHSETTRFLMAGKWEIRKSHLEVIQAFNIAFKEDDDVELLCLTHNPFHNKEQNDFFLNQVYNSRLSSKIRVLDKQESQEGVANIINCADCVVSPSKGEGMNLINLESLACGKQLITTNYSGHTEYCNESNSLLIEFDELEEAKDGLWFNGQGEWGHFGNSQGEQLIAYLKLIHEMKKSGQDMTNHEGLKTVEKFTWSNTVDRLLEAIK